MSYLYLKKEYKPLNPNGGRPWKRYQASQQKSKWTDVALDNSSMNFAYNLLIKRIKGLYSGLKIEVYERDHRNDSTFNATTIYTFITKELYLELECDYVYHKCQLLYDIERCHHETQIRKWLKEYPFSVSSIHKPPTGGITAYFNRIKAYQGDSQFYIL